MFVLFNKQLRDPKRSERGGCVSLGKRRSIDLHDGVIVSPAKKTKKEIEKVQNCFHDGRDCSSHSS